MTIPLRFNTVGALEREQHYYLKEGDVCFFWGEYTPYSHTGGQNWNYSPTNRLMSNFKKKLDRKGQPDWKYKTRAVSEVGSAYAKMFNWQALLQLNPIFVPIPPSKARGDAMYDSRMFEMLRFMAAISRQKLDIRDCLSFDGRYAASHESDDRPSPDDLFDALSFDLVAGRPAQQPGMIMLFDDMLTTGAHFIAASRKMREHFPHAPIVGQFIARRTYPDHSDVFVDLTGIV